MFEISLECSSPWNMLVYYVDSRVHFEGVLIDRLHPHSVPGKCHLNIMKLRTNLSTFVFIGVHGQVGQVVYTYELLNLESCYINQTTPRQKVKTGTGVVLRYSTPSGQSSSTSTTAHMPFISIYSLFCCLMNTEEYSTIVGSTYVLCLSPVIKIFMIGLDSYLGRDFPRSVYYVLVD